MITVSRFIFYGMLAMSPLLGLTGYAVNDLWKRDKVVFDMTEPVYAKTDKLIGYKVSTIFGDGRIETRTVFTAYTDAYIINTNVQGEERADLLARAERINTRFQ